MYPGKGTVVLIRPAQTFYERINIAHQICRGLQAAYGAGVEVHRDIKPQNVLLATDGTMKLTDFGIARAVDLSGLTATGAVIGTPHYMSPEQAMGERATSRSDIYAIGVTLYQMLSGELPFIGDTPMAVLEKHRRATPRKIRQVRAEVPRALESVIERCLAKDPNRRYQTPRELAQALQEAVPAAVTPPLRPRAATPPPAAAPPRPPTPPLEITALDRYTVRFFFSEPNAVLLESLVKYHAYITPSDVDPARFARESLGTGPFIMTNHAQGAREFEKNPDYWNEGLPLLDEVIFIYLSNAEELAGALVSGGIDVIYDLNISSVDSLREHPDTVVAQAPSGSYMNLAMDVRQPPFDNVLVRKALQAATDREAILEGAQRGLGGIAYDHPILPGDPVFNPSCRPPEYDPQLARALLEDAGYPDGIDLTLYTGNPGGASMVEMAEVFQKSAAPAGINIEIVVMPGAGYWTDVWMQKPFTTVWWSGRPPHEAFSVVYRSDAVWNESYWSNPDFDALLEKTLWAESLEDRMAIFGEIQCLVVEEVPRIIPVFRPVLLGLRENVRGIEPMWDATLSLHRAWFEDAPSPIPTATVALVPRFTAVPVPTATPTVTAVPTPANIFTVTSSADVVDTNPGDGICDDGFGQCTLRAAIMEANVLPGHNSINLPAGTYTLTIAGIGEDAARTGDLDIAGHLSITGADRARTIIDGGGKDRVFDILGPSVSPGEVRAEVEIVVVTIQNGNLSDISGPHQPEPPCGIGNAGVDATGGGVRIGINSTLTLADSNVHGNSAGLGFGGGIYNRGSLTITNSDISGNTAYNGGGIAGAVNITDSTVSENAACSTGGGIWGGGIDISYSTVKDNTAGQRGAGICNCGVGVTLTITNGTVSGNNAGDGIGGGIINFGTLTVTNSTVNGNTASRGGGIFNDGAVVTLTNSTVSENVALSGIGGIYNDRGGSLDVANTSIVDNSGGGILSDGTVVFINAIIANIPPGVDCGGGFTSLGHNLDSDGTCNLTQPTDLPNTDPLLGPLQDNGGTTFTHALLPGSPAIDAGDDANCPDPDQRGVARPQGAACDIGAFEFGASVTATPTPTFVPLPPQPQGPRGTLNVIDDLGNEQWLLRNANGRPMWYIGEPLVWVTSRQVV